MGRSRKAGGVMNDYFDNIDRHLRKKYRLPAGWRAFRWALLEPWQDSPGVHITGAVAPLKTRGRNKGEPNWRLKDKESVREFCVLNSVLSRINKPPPRRPRRPHRRREVMSQHSDELRAILVGISETGASLAKDCGHPVDEIGLGLMADAAKGIAVLDEAAKPAPGGPKMREVGWYYELAHSIDGETGEFSDWRPRIDLEPPGPHITCVRNVVPLYAFVPEPTEPEVPARVDGEGE
jgi:hypothetical protein